MTLVTLLMLLVTGGALIEIMTGAAKHLILAGVVANVGIELATIVLLYLPSSNAYIDCSAAGRLTLWSCGSKNSGGCSGRGNLTELFVMVRGDPSRTQVWKLVDRAAEPPNEGDHRPHDEATDRAGDHAAPMPMAAAA
jgi:hypothetical protein